MTTGQWIAIWLACMLALSAAALLIGFVYARTRINVWACVSVVQLTDGTSRVEIVHRGAESDCRAFIDAATYTPDDDAIDAELVLMPLRDWHALAREARS